MWFIFQYCLNVCLYYSSDTFTRFTLPSLSDALVSYHILFLWCFHTAQLHPPPYFLSKSWTVSTNEVATSTRPPATKNFIKQVKCHCLHGSPHFYHVPDRQCLVLTIRASNLHFLNVILFSCNIIDYFRLLSYRVFSELMSLGLTLNVPSCVCL